MANHIRDNSEEERRLAYEDFVRADRAKAREQQISIRKSAPRWLWILGWIFILPLPLTILIVRKKPQGVWKIVSIVLLSLLWLCYAFIVAAACSGQAEETAPEGPRALSSDSSSASEVSMTVSLRAYVPTTSQTISPASSQSASVTSSDTSISFAQTTAATTPAATTVVQSSMTPQSTETSTPTATTAMQSTSATVQATSTTSAPKATTTTPKATTTTTAKATTMTTTTTPKVTTPAATKALRAPSNAVNVIEQGGTNVCHRNEIVTCNFYGYANTEYDIDVYYSSGASKADGLQNKTSDASGHVKWTWRIGGKTNSGNYKIVISGGVEKITIPFTVSE